MGGCTLVRKRARNLIRNKRRVSQDPSYLLTVGSGRPKILSVPTFFELFLLFNHANAKYKQI